MRYKLGLRPVAAQPRVSLCAYYTSDLPDVESLKYPLGHADAIQPEMFCNDVVGDCAIAGSIEEVRLANALRGITVNFTDDTAIENYAAITGYDGDPATDNGTDVHQLYDYRQSTGIVDADGNYHKIVAYAGLTPGDFDELLIALSLFDMVGIGIKVPDYCDTQFANGQPWDLVTGRHQIEGQHYIPVVGATDRDLAQVYTWGATQGITSAFYNAMNTVAVVALTEELFSDGKTPEGIDRAKLAADLPQLNTGPVMAKAPKRSRQDARPAA
ncbi:hypothetical protein [Mycobacterium intracellulare]|uniref:hypothetical protein n=1 Tax=Mycobacterium intracellulare TaxID=1767 RepID=UPI00109ED7D0|nr:hypothetical protein [Mycobacterium intracellulare]